MKILYYSVHAILEDDEVRLLKSLGHDVCCLGINGPDGIHQNFRPAIQFSDRERDLYQALVAAGGSFSNQQPYQSHVLPPAFIDLFDVVIVMHDIDVIEHFWESFSRRPVIWRTIGQGIERLEHRANVLRQRGMFVARYTPTEAAIPGTKAADAYIRFCKSPDVYSGWSGGRGDVLTFANNYQSRYPDDAADYDVIVEGFPSALGGIGNDGTANAFGMVSWEEQLTRYRQAGAYLYASGLDIPYTLNFIEAWMTGVPLVVHAPLARRGAYFEIDKLIEDGVSGFIARDITTARDKLRLLLSDHALASSMGTKGRDAAIALFSTSHAAAAWTDLLNRVVRTASERANGSSLPVRDHEAAADAMGPDISSKPATPLTPATEPPTESKIMQQPIEPHRPVWMLKALSLLKPYDLPSMSKKRVGVQSDGGYVVFEDFEAIGAVYSFGIGFSISFDTYLADLGKPIYMFDHTIEGPVTSHPAFNFFKQGIAGIDQPDASLFTLAHQIHRLGHADRNDMFLKIDVEGAEYDALVTMSVETLKQFRQLVIEVHWLDNLTDEAWANRFINVFEKINSVFTLGHVHGNNCAPVSFVQGIPVVDVLELTYVRSDLVTPQQSRTVYPTPLDFANREGSQDILLWFYPFLPTDPGQGGESEDGNMRRSLHSGDQSIRLAEGTRLRHRLAALEREAAQIKDELVKLA